MVLEEFFRNLNKKNLDYCVIRNWKDIDNHNSGSLEIDLLVSEQDHAELVKLVEEAGFHLKWVEETYDAKYDFIDVNQEIRLHIHRGCMNYNNLRLVEAEKMLENREKQNFYYKPSDAAYTTGLILHCVFDKYCFKEFYRQEISKNIESYEKDILNLLEDFSPKYGSKILQKIKDKDFKQAYRFKWKIILRETSILQKKRLLKLWIKHQQLKLQIPFLRTKTVSFTGVQGSGKSTSVEETKKLLEPQDAEEVKLGIYRQQSLLLKFLVRLRQKIRSNDKEEGKSRSLQSKYNRRTPLRNIVFLLDMKWGLMRAKVQNPSYIITDRYLSDIFKQSKPDTLTKKLFSILDSSDAVILVYNDPEVICNRREGTNKEIVEKRMKQLEHNLEDLNIPYYKIKTEDREETLIEIKKVLNRLEGDNH